MRYQDLNHALKYFRKQVSEGIEYALTEMPSLPTAQKVWNYLKPRTIYKNDPKGVELFQTLETLLNADKNYHGIAGAGDCDCFTGGALSTLLANGFDCGIVLAGRNPLVPVHIWAYVIDENGKRKEFDLTNKRLNETRHYPFTQSIPYKLNKKEKNMILQLAEGGNKSSYHPYIWLPSKGVQVREDYFDHLKEADFQKQLLSEGYEPGQIAELSKGRAARQAAKATKQQNKIQHKAAKGAMKNEKKAAKPRNIRKQQKQDRKSDRSASKNIKRESNAQVRLYRAQNQPQENLYPDAEEIAYEEVYDPNTQYETVEYVETEQSPEDVFDGVSEFGGVEISKTLAFIAGSFIAGAIVGKVTSR